MLKEKNGSLDHLESEGAPDQLAEKPENAYSQESISKKIDLFSAGLQEKVVLAQKTTGEALGMIERSEKELAVALPEDRSQVSSEIANLDAEIEKVAGDGVKTLEQEKSALAGAEDAPEVDFKEEFIKLLDKSNALELRYLKTAAPIVYKEVQEYAAGLGVELSDLPPDKINFDAGQRGTAGFYSIDEDTINLKSTDSLASVVIHEGLHFATAVDTRQGEKMQGERRLAKTGFYSSWQKKEGGQEEQSAVLSGFNEAVTEKMAKEIFNRRRSEIAKSIEEASKPFAVEREAIIKEQKEIDLRIFEKNAQERYSNQAFIVPIDEPAAPIEPVAPQSFEEFKEAAQKSMDDEYDSKLKSSLSDRAVDDIAAYRLEIKALDAILDKLARERAASENIPQNVALAKEWREMQVAYLRGNTMYLRRVERAVGPQTLRKFNEFDRRKFRKREETKEEFEKKINNFIAEINS